MTREAIDGPHAGLSMEILTPDQRLRVFVSSTLRELAPERTAVKEAVESLRLAPVLFELGARPHPPRNLYRAYIEQSHIFIGIYWESYGWVAPEMEISGLEDEYHLSADMPKLIYVKSPAPERAPGLTALLDEIRSDDRVSYKAFGTPQRLAELVKDDLALLLTERFYEGRSGDIRSDVAPMASASIPVQPTAFVGRERELRDIAAVLLSDETRLLSLVGPGGIGKTRLAVEIAGRVQDDFADGVRFLELAALRDARRFEAHLVDELGIKDNTSDASQALDRWLQQKRLLLVFDNFEQLLEASEAVARLVHSTPTCKFLVTSRAVLRVRGEREYVVPPMSLPEGQKEGARLSDALILFKQRADQARPGIDLTGAHELAAVEICRRVDGLPLAIELAAARVKVMSPEQLLARLRNRLDLLVGGARDMPERQQTLRATIDWSFQLLSEDEKRLFARMAVFRRGATLEAIETVCAPAGDIDVFEAVASLLEKSLLRQELSETGEARFWMLETIREFSAELFEASAEGPEMKDRHASFYVDLCRGAQAGTAGKKQQTWFARIDADYPNIRLAAARLFERGKPAPVAEMAWNLVLFTWVAGHMGDARRACQLVLQFPDIDTRTRAYALGAGGAATFWQGDVGEALPMVVQARALFEEIEDPLGEALCLLLIGMVTPEIEGIDAAEKRLTQAVAILERIENRGWLALAMTAYCWMLMLAGRHEGKTELYERAVEMASDMGAELTLGMSYGNLGQHRRWQGRLDESIELQMRAIRPLVAADHVAAISYTFLNASETLVALGQREDAARLIGLSEALLEDLKVLPISMMEALRMRLNDQLRAEMGEVFTAAHGEGRSLRVAEGLELIAANVPARG